MSTPESNYLAAHAAHEAARAARTALAARRVTQGQPRYSHCGGVDEEMELAEIAVDDTAVVLESAAAALACAGADVEPLRDLLIHELVIARDELAACERAAPGLPPMRESSRAAVEARASAALALAEAARSVAARREAAIARLRAVYAATAEALDLVRAERRAAGLPPPGRVFPPVPPTATGVSGEAYRVPTTAAACELATEAVGATRRPKPREGRTAAEQRAATRRRELEAWRAKRDSGAFDPPRPAFDPRPPARAAGA